MQLPVRVDLDAYHGDSWSQTFRLRTEVGVEDLTGAFGACWAIDSKGDRYTLDVEIDGPVGEVTISWNGSPIPAGVYDYDLEITHEGAVKTWARGALNVEQDITNA